MFRIKIKKKMSVIKSNDKQSKTVSKSDIDLQKRHKQIETNKQKTMFEFLLFYLFLPLGLPQRQSKKF